MTPIEPEWGGRYLIHDVPCRVAPHDGGWLVASTSEPYFCFWGKTEADAVASAERGIRYYRSVRQPKDKRKESKNYG
jgi:predicted RNase H-like HicB family nuclease